MTNFYPTTGVDTFTGTTDADLVIFTAANQANAGDSFDAVSGLNDVVWVNGAFNLDLTLLGNAFFSFEYIAFAAGANAVTLNGSQLDGSAGAFPLDLRVQGETGTAQTIYVNNATSFDGSGWLFTLWDQAADWIFLAGASGDDTITGTSQDDIVHGYLGDDILRGAGGSDELNGGADNDTFLYLAGDAGDRDELGGGSGIDTIELRGGGEFDLRDISVSSIEGVTFAEDALISWVHLSTEHFDGPGELAPDLLVTGKVAGSSHLDVFATATQANADLRGLTFASWGPSDFVSFTGTGAANRFFGTRQTDWAVGGGGSDTLNGWGGNDTIYGGSNADTLRGQGGNDRLFGQSGNDAILGGGGRDRLVGASGVDWIQGDRGKDLMTGGTNADTFAFLSKADSGRTAKTADVITDFRRNLDDIDLRAIDASTVLNGNNAFTFKGTAGIGISARGEVSYEKVNKPGTAKDHTLVYVDTDSDRAAEMVIKLTGLITLTAGDFIL